MSVTRTFFGELLPGLVVSRFDDFLLTEGSVAFDVVGEGGGRWTLRFGGAEPIEEGFDETADLKLSFDEAAFEGFVDGTLDTVAAVMGGQIRAQGDLALLASLSMLMSPPQNDLGWDAS